MRGFLLRHKQLGLGKVVQAARGALRIYFIDSRQQHDISPRELQGGMLEREQLARGARCRALQNGDTGEVVVQGLSGSMPRPADPYAYVVCDEGAAAGVPRVVSEVDLLPLDGAESADPLVRLAGARVQPYRLFQSRETLRRAYARLVRDGAGLRALLASRVDLRPHQAFVAGTVMLDPRRRYILADEVGLGKTIEAGLVIHDLLAQKPDAKILVMCPGALTQQWLCEMYSKFGGQLFQLVDLHDPLFLNWRGVRRAIVSTTLAACKVGPILEKIRWDMVVVDEVHHLLASSALYGLVERLSQRAPSLLLLSAVPAHEREDEFLRLLALLEPERYAAPQARAHFAALYALQTQLGRGLRVLTRRIEGYERGEFTLDDVHPIAQRVLDLDVVRHDDDLRHRLVAIADSPRVRAAEPEEPSVDGAAHTAIAPQAAGLEVSRVAVAEAQVAPSAQSATTEGRAAIGAEFRRLVHDVADRYRINRRILRNRRQRLIEQAQMAAIERRVCHAGYAPDQLELEAVDAVERLLRTARDQGLDADAVAAFARTALQSTASPTTMLGLLLGLQQTDAQPVNSDGRELVLMGHTVGYTDWDLHQALLFRIVRAHVPASPLAHAIAAARTWRDAGPQYARADRLLTVLAAHDGIAPRPKVLVFAGYPGLAAEVLRAVQERYGVKAAAEFRAQLEPEVKEANVLRWQRDPLTWILVSDETGGEGRNFQFAAELIHYDTPWHAARVEQRIGRLDRLGRERGDVTSTVVYNTASVEAGLVRCYDEGVGVYRSSISGLEFALRTVERDLLTVAVADGRDALLDRAPSVRMAVERERAQDDSEAVLDEASFEQSAAAKYRTVVRSDRAERDIEFAVLDYLRALTENSGVQDLQDPAHPKAVWRVRPEQTRFGPLPVDDRNTQPLVGNIDGTFRRSVAQQRPTLHFFTIGDPLFDAVMRSLDVHGTGRTYAVECAVPEVDPWIGFEFAFAPAPDLAEIAASPGLANQARAAFAPKLLRVFVSIDGRLANDKEALVSLRRRCEHNKQGQTWWDLSPAIAAILPRILGHADWQDALLRFHARALEVASAEILDRIGADLRAEVARIDSAERHLTELARQGDVDAKADAEAMERLRAAILGWRPMLDAVGFLSVNGRVRHVTSAPR